MLRSPQRIDATSHRRLAAALLACLALFVGHSPSLTAAEDPALEQYLSRLGLTDLRLTYLERLLADESTPNTKLQLAGKLADAYAEELTAVAEQPEQFAKIRIRAENLLAEFPAVRSPAVQAALLQADYQRSEGLVIRWMENPLNSKPLQEAAESLAKIQPRLVALHSELVQAEEQALEALDRLKNDAARQAAEAQLSRQRTVAIRTDYFAGWSAYYLGVARLQTTNADRKSREAPTQDFATAKQHFLRVLDIADEKDYSQIEAEALGLDSIWRARTTIGLGLVEIVQRHAVSANRIFGWLAHGSVPAVIRDQAAYWQLQGMFNAGQYDVATKFATKQITALSGSPSAGKSSLCIAAIHGGAARRTEGQQLVDQGIHGLARMRQFDTADKLIVQYKLDERATENFCLAWLRGRREYLAAEKTKKTEGFQAAERTLTAALALPEARGEAGDAAQARYYLAWAKFRLGEIETAGRLFHDAAIALAFAAPELASQAAWMHCTCLVQLAAKDKRQATAAIAALEAFQHDYPSSEEAQQVELLVARLRQNQLEPREAIRELSAIKPGDVNFVSAQYEIAQLQYQLWNNAKTDAGQAQPLAAEMLKTVDGFLAASDPARDGTRRVKATLLSMDVLLNGASPAWDRAATLLTSVTSAAEQQTPTNPAAIEYQYRRLQLAEHRGDQPTVNAAAKIIVLHGTGTVFELPALVASARAADEAVKSATAAERIKQATAAATLYARLVKLLDDSPTTLATNKNALAASSKLAQYDEELEHWDAAANRLNKLVTAQPKDRRLLRRAGLACFHAGQFATALNHWRTLATGLTSGSDEWFEAKYFQIVCLEKTDSTAAQNVLQQFRVLFPEVKSAAWRDKFAELAQRLESR